MTLFTCTLQMPSSLVTLLRISVSRSKKTRLAEGAGPVVGELVDLLQSSGNGFLNLEDALSLALQATLNCAASSIVVSGTSDIYTKEQEKWIRNALRIAVGKV